jgi:ankyrin repeat protein
MTNNVNLLRTILAFGDKCIDDKDENGFTLLHKAVSAVDIAQIDILINCGADLTVPDRDGNTALHIACYQKCELLIKLLVSAGADPDVMNDVRFSVGMIFA